MDTKNNDEKKSQLLHFFLRILYNEHFQKFYVLILLTIQCASHTLVTRYSRGILKEEYSLSSTLLFSEGIKLIVSTVFVIYEKRSTGQDSKEVFRHFVNIVLSSIVFTPPAVLYFIQNLLVMFSLSYLSAPIFTIINQLKILTTAVFTVVIIRRKITFRKWLALFILLVGVVLVNVQPNGSEDKEKKSKSLVGIISAVCVTILSGFTGVYIELFLKKRSQEFSIWDRNVQLALNSILLASITPWIIDGSKIWREGYFSGYSLYTVELIILNACGGILVAIVIKISNNVVKGFAVSCAIVISTFYTWLFWHFEINILFMIGTFLVVISIFTYMDYSKKKTSDSDMENSLANNIVVIEEGSSESTEIELVLENIESQSNDNNMEGEEEEEGEDVEDQGKE